MRNRALFLPVVALLVLPLPAIAQDAVTGWGAMSLSIEGGTWAVQNSSASWAPQSALASCWNHSKQPTQCVVGVGAFWLAAGHCVHRTPAGMVFTRIGVTGGQDEEAARRNVIQSLIRDGNVRAADCTIVAAISATTGAAAKPPGQDL